MAQGSDSFGASTYTCDMSSLSINLLLPEGSSYWLGFGRACVFTFIVILNLRYIALSKRRNDQHAVKAMVLPMLMKLIYAYIVLNIIVAVVGIGTIEDTCRNRFKGIFLAFEMGAFHSLLEGLAFYLMRYGTGWRAIRDSMLTGLLWGIITFIVFFIQMNLFCGAYNMVGLSVLPVPLKRNIWLGMSVGYNTVLMVFYGTFVVLPTTWLYRRPALKLYARFQFIYQIFWIISSTLVYHHLDSTNCLCALSAFAILLMVIVHPTITYYALQLDSQYWQGLVPDEGNPLADVWGSVGIETATSMARGISDLEVRSTVKLLHFGLLELDSELGYVPGGFSRVYFGTLRRKEAVAVKVIYSIELTPHEIKHFCREARILGELEHPNIVQCLGVCVMPPALALVFENCKYGSLFNFLYVAKVVLPTAETQEQLSQEQRPEAMLTTEALKNLGGSSSSSSGDRNVVRSPLALSTGAQSISHSLGSPQPQVSLANSLGSLSHSPQRLGLEPALPQSSAARGLLHLSDVIPSASLLRRLDDVIPAASGAAASQVDEEDTQSAATATGLLGAIQSIVGRIQSSRILPGQDGRVFSLSRDSRALRMSRDVEAGLMDIRASAAVGGEAGGVNGARLGLESTRPSSVTVRQSSNEIEMSRPSNVPVNPPAPAPAPPQPVACSLAALLSTEERMNLMLDAAAAINFMHKRGVLHCDIKSLNFLVCEVPEEIPPPPPSAGSGTPKSPGHKARSPKSSPSGNSSPTALPHRLQHSNSFGSSGGSGKGAAGSSDPQQPRTCRYMLKLADMGEARTPAEVLELPKPPSPSRNWAPPEILGADARPESYTSASDVFGLALVLSEIALLALPFGEFVESVTPDEWLRRLQDASFRPVLPTSLPPQIRLAIKQGWASDPTKRCSSADLVKVLESTLGLPPSEEY